MSEMIDKRYDDSYRDAALKADIKRDIRPEMTSLVEIKNALRNIAEGINKSPAALQQRIAAIEQGQVTAANLLDSLHTEQEEIATSQSILCERLDALTNNLVQECHAIRKERENDMQCVNSWQIKVFNELRKAKKPKRRKR